MLIQAPAIDGQVSYRVTAESNSGNSDPSNVVTVVPNPAVDYDTDDDGLIEVSNLEQLNAMRWDLDGSGAADTAGNAQSHGAAFPGAALVMGCASLTCTGYELTADLDFEDAGSYASGSVNTSWTSGTGWEPIPSFNTLFEGNGHTISNLFIDRPSTDGVGLFTSVTSGSGNGIYRVGIVDADVTGQHTVGALVAFPASAVRFSYSSGRVTGQQNVGGLIGRSQTGAATAIYSTAAVTGTNAVGGLVGLNEGAITAGYATGRVSGTDDVGGLVGRLGATGFAGTVVASYARGSVTGTTDTGRAGGTGPERHGHQQLLPTAFAAPLRHRQRRRRQRQRG